MLRIAIPKGSLEKMTLNLFQQAGLPIVRPNDRNYNPVINDDRISEVGMYPAEEIPGFIESGKYDLGITGWDWIVETESRVHEIADLRYSKGGWNEIRLVLATNELDPVNDPKEIKPGSRVVTEYPQITRKFFDQLGVRVRIIPSAGATEAKVPMMAEYLTDITETGATLRQHGKKILETILTSSTRLIASPEAWKDSKKRIAIHEIAEMLMSVVRAAGKVLIKMNVKAEDLEGLLAFLPSMRSPTISPLFNRDEEKLWYAVETVAERSKLNTVLSNIRKMGAVDILVMNVEKIIP